MAFNTISIGLMVIMSFLSIQVKAICEQPIIKCINDKKLTSVLLDETKTQAITISSNNFFVSVATLITDAEYIFIGDTDTNRLFKYGSNGVFINQTRTTKPSFMTQSSNKVFTSNSQNVSVFDAELNNLQIKSGLSNVKGIHYDLSSEKLYVVESDLQKITILNNTLDEIDSFYWTQSGGEIRSISVYNDIVYLGNSDEILVFQNKGFVSSYGVCSGSNSINDIHIDQCEGYLLATCLSRIELWKIDGTTLTYVATKTLTDIRPYGITIDSNERIIFTSTLNVNGFIILS